MATVTTYNVVGMTTVPSLDGLSDVVTTVRWQVAVTYTVESTTYIAQQTGIDPVGPPDATDFTAYPDLTEAQVLGWIPDHGSDPVLLGALANVINAQIVPESVPVFPPWGTS